MIFLMTLIMQLSSNVLLSWEICYQTLIAKINIITTRIRIISATQTNVSRLSNTRRATSTPVTTESMWLQLTELSFLWLNVYSKSFQCYFLPFSSQQNTVLSISIVKTFFLAWFFNTGPASERVGIWVPSAPVKWIRKHSLTVCTLGICNVRDQSIFYQVLLNLKNCWVDVF